MDWQVTDHQKATVISTYRSVLSVYFCLETMHTCMTHRHQPHRDNEASFLEVFDKGNGVLLEVGQTAVDGLGVIIGSSLLLGSFVQPFLQTVVGAGQKHHQVRGADLAGHR